MGGKWNKKAGGHVFDEDVDGLLNGLFDEGEVINKKKEFGFFETPKELVERMAELAGLVQEHPAVKIDDYILEPSAGMGAIADVLVEKGCRKDHVWCVEVDEKRYKALGDKGYTVVNADFMSDEADKVFDTKFDKVIMNPPFTRGIDIDHVTQAFRFLKDGGTLVAVMSSGAMHNSSKKATAFRKLMEENGRFEDIPAGMFKKSGTMVNTVLCIMQKGKNA